MAEVQAATEVWGGDAWDDLCEAVHNCTEYVWEELSVDDGWPSPFNASFRLADGRVVEVQVVARVIGSAREAAGVTS